MNINLAFLGVFVLLTCKASAVITLTGTALTGLSTLAPVGTLVLLVVDDPASNFGGMLAPLSGDLTAASVNPLSIASASITTGETFGGDIVLGRLAVTSAGALPGGFVFDNPASLQGDRFSLIFLPSLGITSTNANVISSTTYGIVSGSDWILPAVNGGESFSFSATDALGVASFFRVTVAAGVATNDTYASSSGANLTLVPEPGTALLAALGSLLMLRRRREVVA